MKEIKIKVTDEQYDAYQLDIKYQLHSGFGGQVWDEEALVSPVGTGVATKINFIEKAQKYLISGNLDDLDWLYCPATYRGKPTKNTIKELNKLIHNEESIACVKHWNKYNPDDKIIL